MADITVGGSLIPSTGNTPLDKRSRIESLSDAANIQNPVIGSTFYCVSTGKTYLITSLKAKTIGALVVQNAAVDAYQIVPDQEQLNAKANQQDLISLGDRVSILESSTVVSTGNVIGGYAVKALAYNASTYQMTLDPGESDSRLGTDMSKFTVGAQVVVNVLTEDSSLSDSIQIWGVYKSAEIAAIDAANYKLTFTQDIGIDTSNQLQNIFCRVADPNRKDAAYSSGDRNFVTGDAASADGLINTVTGTGAKASGTMNTVTGNFSGAEGANNTVLGNRSFAFGGNNTVSADLSFVSGNGNQIQGQAAIVIGESNREVTGVNVKILGDGNKASGNRTNLIGFYNEASGDQASALGNGLKVAAKKALLIGQQGQLSDALYNQGAVAIAGGDVEDGTKCISFIHRSRKADDLDETATEPAFSHEYRGRLRPMILEVSDSGAIELDHDQYAKWVITVSGNVVLVLKNWESGDIGDVVVNTTNTSVIIPQDWIVDSDFSTTLTSGDIHIITIRKETVGNASAIFAQSI